MGKWGKGVLRQHVQQEQSFLLGRGGGGVEHEEPGAKVPRLEARVLQGASCGQDTDGWGGTIRTAQVA